MILLTSTGDLVQLITGGTQAVKIHASWVDLASGTSSPGRTNTAVSSATTTTIVGSPGSSTQRTVKFLSIYNSDASNPAAITVQHTDATTVVILQKISLLAGYTLTYNDLSGWLMLDATGARVQSPMSGRFLGSTILTSASGTFTTQAATNTLFLRGVGSGGGGGGTNGTASGAGGGGGAGSYLEKTAAVAGNTGYSYTCGVGGTSATSSAGTAGTGTTTFVIGATTYTCNPGQGGAQGVGSGALVSAAGGAGGTVSTNGDLNTTGDPGKYGAILIATATGVGASGPGASSVFGAGGVGLVAAGTGTVAGGFGSGGAGGLNLTTVARAGGSGTNGCWLVEEYS